MSTAKNQRQRILDLLIEARGGDVASPLLSRISLQYGARVLELRRMGFKIVNRTERIDGKTHGYFSLELGTGGPATAMPSTPPVNAQAGLFQGPLRKEFD